MTNINNHEVGMNKINLAEDIQELTCEEAAAIHGGAQIALFRSNNFSGRALFLSASRSGKRFKLGRLRNGSFNNSISSVVVFSGVWQLRSDKDGGGLGVTLSRGSNSQYTFRGSRFNNIASLVIAKYA